MAYYDELSRRGLINLNKDFDNDNQNSLKEYLNSSETVYEPVRPIEQVIERLDEATDAVKARGGVVSDAIMSRVNDMFDGIIDSITKEINRCDDVAEESEDDDQFPDEEDLEEDDPDEVVTD